MGACLLATSTVLLEDVFIPLRKSGGTGSVAQSRAVTLVLGVAATVIACLTDGVIAALTVAYDLLVGALFVPVMGAILWRRGTASAALAARGIDSDAPIYGGLGLSGLVFVIMSLAERAPRVAEETVASEHP